MTRSYPKNRQQNVTPSVMEYMKTREGEQVHITEVAKALGARATSVGSSLSRACRFPDTGVSRTERQGFYVYNRPGKPAEKPVEAPVRRSVQHSVRLQDETLYRRVGAARDGALILESDGGTLYRAEEL